MVGQPSLAAPFNVTVIEEAGTEARPTGSWVFSES
jgi:hypothetical protein